MKKVLLTLAAVIALLPTLAFADGKQTEIDVNIKTATQFFQFRPQMDNHNFHFEYYKNLADSKWSYGLIYQLRDGTDLQWHQLIYAFEPYRSGKWMVKGEFKANWIPSGSVHPGVTDTQLGVHPRLTTHYNFTSSIRANFFVEPRWQGSTYIGNKSRLTMDYQVTPKDQVSFGFVNYGNAAEELSAEIQYVVMYTRKL